MSRGNSRTITVAVGLALFSTGSWPVVAWGDGGTLRDWQRRGRWEIAVFTDPTPFVTGTVDISVLVLDADTGDPVPGARVTVEVVPREHSGVTASYLATPEAATNKLFSAAVFDLPDPGRYEMSVNVERDAERARLQFDLDVANPSTPEADLWWWIVWPAPVVAVYGMHRWLVARRERSAVRGSVLASDDGVGSDIF